jgi:hypothetical protein
MILISFGMTKKLFMSILAFPEMSHKVIMGHLKAAPG